MIPLSRSLALVGVLAAASPALAVDTVVRRGGEFVVNSQTYGNQRRVDVASSSAGEFVVVWQTYPGYEFDIHAQRYDAAAASAGSAAARSPASASDRPDRDMWPPRACRSAHPYPRIAAIVKGFLRPLTASRPRP